MAASGIYAIQHLTTGRTYIGSSVSVVRRWREHRSALNAGLHCCPGLQEDWSRDGEAAFSFVILAHVHTQDALIAVEQSFIDNQPNLYNTNGRAGSGPKPGFHHSAATRQLIAARVRGKTRSLATRLRIAAARAGKPLSIAHRAAIGASRKGHRHSAETKAKMRAKALGRPVNGAAISAAKRGKPWSSARWAAYDARYGHVSVSASAKET